MTPLDNGVKMFKRYIILMTLFSFILQLTYGQNKGFSGGTTKKGGRTTKKGNQVKKRANEQRYRQLIEQAKNSPDCDGLLADDFSYSCATYKVSP